MWIVFFNYGKERFCIIQYWKYEVTCLGFMKKHLKSTWFLCSMHYVIFLGSVSGRRRVVDPWGLCVCSMWVRASGPSGRSSRGAGTPRRASSSSMRSMLFVLVAQSMRWERSSHFRSVTWSLNSEAARNPAVCLLSVRSQRPRRKPAAHRDGRHGEPQAGFHHGRHQQARWSELYWPVCDDFGFL